MIKSFYTKSEKTAKTDEEQYYLTVAEICTALKEATTTIVNLYDGYREAARLLRENKIETPVDMPEEQAEAVLDVLATLNQTFVLTEGFACECIVKQNLLENSTVLKK